MLFSYYECVSDSGNSFNVTNFVVNAFIGTHFTTDWRQIVCSHPDWHRFHTHTIAYLIFIKRIPVVMKYFHRLNACVHTQSAAQQYPIVSCRNFPHDIFTMSSPKIQNALRRYIKAGFSEPLEWACAVSCIPWIYSPALIHNRSSIPIDIVFVFTLHPLRGASLTVSD